MKTTITNNKIISTITKRFLATIILGAALTSSAKAQMFCQAAFTYAVGSSGQVNFTNTSTGTSGSTIYTWNFGNGTYSGLQSPSCTYAYNGKYYVTLGIDSSNGGCSSYVTDSVTITNALTCSLNAAFTYTTGSSGVVNFTDASTGVDPGMVYSWTWAGTTNYLNGSSTQQSPTITFPYNGTYNVTMRVGDPTQTCYRTQTQTIVVTNSQACVVDFTYTLSANGQVDFTNISQGNINYNWNFGDGASSTQQSPSHTYAYNGTYHVNMWADTSNSACGGLRDTVITITNTQNAPTCSAAFTYTAGANGQVNFTNASSGNVAVPLYEWSFGDGSATTSSYGLSSVNHTYTYNGTYNATLYEKDSLTNAVICQNTQSIVITTGSPNTGCHDTAYFYMHRDSSMTGTWDVYLATTSGNSPANATWFWGDGTSSTGLTPTHSYASAGWYTVCLSATFACGDSSYFCQSDSVYRSSSSMVNMVVINTTSATGIKTVTNDVSSVKLYPNPFSENLTINLNSVNGNAFTYTMSDMYGNQIMSEKVLADKGENKVQINTSGISNGVYFVTVTDNSTKKTQTIKVVK